MKFTQIPITFQKDIRIFMNDRTIVKYFPSHILRTSAILLLLTFVITSQAMATTGNENGEKTNPYTEKKAKVDLEAESIEAPPAKKEIKEKSKAIQKRPISSGQFYQPLLIKETPPSNGEDQNAVLSFNVIQYIFEHFKFSEEVY